MAPPTRTSRAGSASSPSEHVGFETIVHRRLAVPGELVDAPGVGRGTVGCSNVLSMRPEAWRRVGQTFRFRGHDVFYRDEGAGPVLLCIHGYPTASWDWHRVWDGLRGRFRLVAPDMLGFGFSAKPRPHRYTIDEQASLHEALLAHLAIPEAHLLAHDYGDTVAQELLARDLDRRRGGGDGGPVLLSCVLLNGGLFPEQHRPVVMQRLLASPLGGLIVRFANEGTFRRTFPRVFGPDTQPTDDELSQAFQLLAQGDGVRIMHRLIHYMAERRTHRDRWVGALVDTPVPRRLIHGRADPVSGRHAAERYRELVPDPDVVLLPGIGHYPQLEAPQQTLEAVLSFHDRAGL